MTLTDQLLCVCDAYCSARSISRARLSTVLLNGGGQLSRIAAGGDLRTSSFERAMRWLSDNWPEGADWPADVERPEPTEAPPPTD